MVLFENQENSTTVQGREPANRNVQEDPEAGHGAGVGH